MQECEGRERRWADPEEQVRVDHGGRSETKAAASEGCRGEGRESSEAKRSEGRIMQVEGYGGLVRGKRTRHQWLPSIRPSSLKSFFALTTIHDAAKTSCMTKTLR